MKRFILFSALAASLVGCGSSGSGGSDTAASGGKVEVEVQAFKGGYDIDFYAMCAKELSDKSANVTYKVGGDERVWESLRPRFISGSVPDLVFPGWGMDHWALVEENQLAPLDEYLKEKPSEGEGTWGDTFDPAILRHGQKDGKTYMLPYYVIVMGWWYDPVLFAKNGWTPPKTYDELMALAPKIKAAGMAPMTFQGKYPYYMVDGMLMPWCYSIGGKEAMLAAQNLEPGAWNSPAMKQAAKMIADMANQGMFQKGAVSMTHTEAQVQFLQGKAAMVPCGTWIKAEMEKQIPKGVKLAYMLPPVVAGGKGDPGTTIIKIEPWMVPSKGKHPREAIDLFKYMTSLSKAKEFVEKKGTLMAIKGSDQVKLPEELVEPARVLATSKDTYPMNVTTWYPTMKSELENALTAMLNGQITSAQFCDRIEKEAEKIRKDDTIVKHKMS